METGEFGAGGFWVVDEEVGEGLVGDFEFGDLGDVEGDVGVEAG